MMKHVLWKTCLFALLPAAALFATIRCNPAVSNAVGGAAAPAAELDATTITTGARMRVVWTRDVRTGGTDPQGKGPNFTLMGLDTADGAGERAILPEVANYRKPFFTQDGTGVVFSDVVAGEIKRVDWDGGGLRTLAKGVALDVHADASGREWVYALPHAGPKTAETMAGRPVWRFPVDEPALVETVWDRTDVSFDTFQLSADGKRAACLSPWPNASIMNLEEPGLERLGRGCWPAMSPDNSYNTWVFDGPHKNLVLRHWDQRFPRKIYLGDAPGGGGFEMYHPRWSNHPRFMAMTGPYKVMGEHNAIGGGGPASIYVGRFNEEFSAIEAWARVTGGEAVDHFPDVWIEGGAEAGVAAPGERPASVVKASGAWPSDHAGLEFLWRGSDDQNEIDRPDGVVRYCRARLRGRARFGQFHQALLGNGGLQGLQIEEELAAAVRGSGQFSIEFAYYIHPRATWPERALIAAVGESADEGNFALIQARLYGKPYLHLKMASGGTALADAPEIELFDLPFGAAVHLALTYADDQVVVYVNGQPAETLDRVRGGLENWAPAPLLLGQAADGSLDWSGMVQNLALYSRALGPDEVASHAAWYADSTKDVTIAPIATVQATLIEKTDPRPPEAIGAYRRDLVEYAYRVDQVISGTVPDKTIKVLHWSILDKQPVPLTKQVGRSYKLLISPKDARPELEGERSNEGTLSDPTLPAYLDVGEP